MWEYKAVVERVVDGDTIIAILDLGFKTYRRERIRFEGIDAPPINTQGGKIAKEVLEKIFRDSKYEIIIKTKKDKQGKYGRYLGRVFVNGIDLNQLLISKGLAKTYTKESRNGNKDKEGK